MRYVANNNVYPHIYNTKNGKRICVEAGTILTQEIFNELFPHGSRDFDTIDYDGNKVIDGFLPEQVLEAQKQQLETQAELMRRQQEHEINIQNLKKKYMEDIGKSMRSTPVHFIGGEVTIKPSNGYKENYEPKRTMNIIDIINAKAYITLQNAGGSKFWKRVSAFFGQPIENIR